MSDKYCKCIASVRMSANVANDKRLENVLTMPGEYRRFSVNVTNARDCT